MAGYGQFCPVAKAMELLDERWTLLVVRELMLGSRHFNEIRRGVPRMSPTLLSTRLRALTRAGVVERWEEGHQVVYRLTLAGQELRPVVEALGAWGVRWVRELGDEDLDPHLLMWDIRRNVDLEALPGGRTVLEFTLHDVPPRARRWWLVAGADGVDLCDADPGYAVTARLESDLRSLTLLWRGDLSWQDALRSGRLAIDGPSTVRRALPRWLTRSVFAGVPRPA
jgi:DNA-binding HxlR family transcriptional regulator